MFGSPFFPEPWGFAGIYTPEPENGQGPQSSTFPLLGRKWNSGLTSEEEEENGNTQRGEMKLISPCLWRGLRCFCRSAWRFGCRSYGEQK